MSKFPKMVKLHMLIYLFIKNKLKKHPIKLLNKNWKKMN